MQAQEGNIYFTELAERVEYGNYDTHYIATIATTPLPITINIVMITLVNILVNILINILVTIATTPLPS